MKNRDNSLVKVANLVENNKKLLKQTHEALDLIDYMKLRSALIVLDGQNTADDEVTMENSYDEILEMLQENIEESKRVIDRIEKH